jgi:hypothetical protein
MADITLEKNHALLEKLSEYVMKKIPQIETELAKKANWINVFELFQQKADKADVLRVEEKVNRLLEGIDHLTKEGDDLRIEKQSISYTLDNHEQRLAGLEERTFGYRVREDGEEEGKITN